MLIVTKDDFIKLKPSTRADLLATIMPVVDKKPVSTQDDFDWDEVVDLSPGQVEELMAGCADITKAGLRVFAEEGPKIHASELEKAGINNYTHFQGRVTKRTRTVTGDKHAYLFAWDDWSSAENNGTGHYAVSPVTFRSLRIYFNLD